MAKDKKAEKPAPGGKKRLLLAAAPVLLLGIGAGLWFSGVLPGLFGMGTTHAAEAHGPAEPRPAPATSRPASFFDMPEIVANLNAPGRRASYIKLRSKLELARPEDAAAMQQAMPRLLDLFNTYLREIRPEELRGSAGSQRLREELMARANLAVGGPKVTDVLFQELLLQ